jgi:hypothetical protein
MVGTMALTAHPSGTTVISERGAAGSRSCGISEATVHPHLTQARRIVVDVTVSRRPACRLRPKDPASRLPRAHSGMMLTCALTTRQPSGNLTQVWLCRPTLPTMLARRNMVLAVAISSP